MKLRLAYPLVTAVAIAATLMRVHPSAEASPMHTATQCAQSCDAASAATSDRDAPLTWGLELVAVAPN